jgi:hypothetical protein
LTFSHSFAKDPSTWGLYRLARQHWLKPSRLLGDNDLRVLETLVLCPRKDFLGNKIHAINLGAEMRQDEVRVCARVCVCVWGSALTQFS